MLGKAKTEMQRNRRFFYWMLAFCTSVWMCGGGTTSFVISFVLAITVLVKSKFHHNSMLAWMVSLMLLAGLGYTFTSMIAHNRLSILLFVAYSLAIIIFVTARSDLKKAAQTPQLSNPSRGNPAIAGF